jgi:hypothetical protein
MGFDLLRRNKLPLPRGEKEFIFPSSITGILGLQLYEFTPFGLEVVHPRTSGISVNLMKKQEFLNCQLVLLAQGQWP